MPVNLTTKAKDPKVINPVESILFGVDFTPLLAAGETLVGTVTVTQTGLTVSGAMVNGSSFLNDAGAPVAIGRGVQMRITGAVDQTDYTLIVSCATTLGNTRAVVCALQCRAN